MANANYETALLEIGRVEALMHSRDIEIAQHESEKKAMRTRVQNAEDATRAAESNTRNLQKQLEATNSELTTMEQRLNTAIAELSTARSRHMQLTSQPGAPFYDPATSAAVECPVLQSNGQIVPLKSVLTRWFASAGPEDGYVFRTYICPLMQQPTTLASLATQDRIRHIAQHAGINITPPLVFSYMSESGWIDFPFHDQLNITSKICAIQTMQITDCVELIIVNHNSMSLEINAAFTQVCGDLLHNCFSNNSLS